VRLAGFAQANDFLPTSKRDPVEFAGSVSAWNRAMDMAGATLYDLDFVELHDCFTIAELVLYEVIGLAPRGHGRRALDEGTVFRGGSLPINLSGGLKAKGHPVGATGVSQHVISAMQLSGTAGDMQLGGARRAAVHNMGGLAVANYVSVLDAV
jgi:acetyl-CoA C-acetyltransferase